MSNSITSATFPMPRHQLPQPAIQQRLGGFAAHLDHKGLPKSALAPSAAVGTGRNMAGVASQHLLNLKN